MTPTPIKPTLKDTASVQPCHSECRSESLVELVGNTPLLRLAGFETPGGPRFGPSSRVPTRGGALRIALP